MTNRDLFMYLVNNYDKNSEEPEYTKKYSEMRKKAEKCGKSIQAAEKVCNIFGDYSKRDSDNIPEKSKNAKIYNKWEKEKEDIVKVIVGREDEEKLKKLNELLKCGKYNESYHWIICYYLYSVIDFIIDKKSCEQFLDEEMSSWRPKGRWLDDPLMYLWLVETVGFELPEEVKKYINNLQENSICPHATLVNDKELKELIKRKYDEKLWGSLCEQIE